jgi:chromosome segregation ATPase
VESYRNVKGKGNSRNGKAILAIDALEYDRQLDTVVSYLLRGTILTDSY